MSDLIKSDFKALEERVVSSPDFKYQLCIGVLKDIVFGKQRSIKEVRKIAAQVLDTCKELKP